MGEINREIKLRLRIGDKIVGYEKWIAGGWIYKPLNDVWSTKYIPHTDKDQFTGLCDKNKREIYEGDICENQYGWIGTIIWDSDKPFGATVPFTGWWWKCKEEKDGKFPLDVDKKTRIIGNVFQNKDLLEKKK